MSVMSVLSLCDGMSCGQIALKELGISVKYYASEVDKFAIAQTQLNFPKTVQLGKLENWQSWEIDWSKIDLILSGTPCQGFSRIGTGKGFQDDRSSLFYYFVDILNFVKSKNKDVKFLFENVVMKKSDCAIISRLLGVQHVQINSSFFSAQSRIRNYWHNIKVVKSGLFDDLYSDIEPFFDKNITIKDILITENDKNITKKHYITPNQLKYLQCRAKKFKMKIISDVNSKAKCLLSKYTNSIFNTHILTDKGIRILTIKEKARLQTIPTWYVFACSDTQAQKMLGNGWTVEVIKHILI